MMRSGAASPAQICFMRVNEFRSKILCMDIFEESRAIEETKGTIDYCLIYIFVTSEKAF